MVWRKSHYRAGGSPSGSARVSTDRDPLRARPLGRSQLCCQRRVGIRCAGSFVGLDREEEGPCDRGDAATRLGVGVRVGSIGCSSRVGIVIHETSYRGALDSYIVTVVKLVICRKMRW